MAPCPPAAEIALDERGSVFRAGQVDEAYLGGIRKNMSNAKRKALEGTGRGAVGKTAVACIKDRASNQVRAQAVRFVDGDTLREFIGWNAEPDATVSPAGPSRNPWTILVRP